MHESVKKIDVPHVDPMMCGVGTIEAGAPFLEWFWRFPKSDGHRRFHYFLSEADKKLAQDNGGQGRTLSHEDIAQYMAGYGRSGEWQNHLDDMDTGFFFWFEMELRKEAQRCQVFAELFMWQVEESKTSS
jgi:hypothetical protein